MTIKNMQGFTLTEVMIVVAIIGIIAAISVPRYLNFIRRSQKESCIANLRLLECAVEEMKFTGVSSVTKEMLIGDDKFIRSEPICPVEKKQYTNINPPTCPSLPADHYISN